MIVVLFLGLMHFSLGSLRKAGSLAPPRFTVPVKEKFSALELDALHQSGQGASVYIHGPITSPGSSSGILGPLRSVFKRVKVLKVPLFWALGPLLGSLLTLLTLASLTPSQVAPQKSNFPPSYGRRPVNGY